MIVQTHPVEVVGDHPHAGRRGTITTMDGKVTTIRPLAALEPMVLVTFGKYDECFAAARHLKPIRSTP